MKKCNHKWRVGSKNAKLIDKEIVVTSLNIWCEKCNKVIKAKYFSDIESKKPINEILLKELNKIIDSQGKCPHCSNHTDRCINPDFLKEDIVEYFKRN